MGRRRSLSVSYSFVRFYRDLSSSPRAKMDLPASNSVGDNDASNSPGKSPGSASAAPGPPSPLDNLPFDIWTLAKGVWSWKWIFVVGTVLSVFFAAGVAYLLAPQFWTSEAVLIYHEPSDESLAEIFEDPGIGTHMKMIMVDSVLNEARTRAQLGASMAQVASACTVDNPKGTNLVHIRFKWTKQEVVEPMAATIVHLARCFGQQGEAVMMVDGAIRDGTVENDLRQLVLADGEEPDGLGDFLAGNIDDPEQIVWPTTLFGVTCVPRSQFGIVPELLGSRRMRELIDEVVEDQNILIIDGPPVSESSDAEILCSLVDAIIIVVEACRFRSQSIKRSLQRIKDTGVPVMGVVLNKVPPLYVESQWK
jgi:hypothetical protein